MWFLLIACAANTQRIGLLEEQGAGVMLVEPDGRQVSLSLVGDATLLKQCVGCQVAATGPRWGKRLVVREWEVRDAGDGSVPYVGLLRRYGGNWLIDDRNTGQPVVLDQQSAGAMAAAEGEVVVVSGYIVGAQTIRVVSWRSLGRSPSGE